MNKNISYKKIPAILTVIGFLTCMIFISEDFYTSCNSSEFKSSTAEFLANLGSSVFFFCWGWMVFKDLFSNR